MIPFSGRPDDILLKAKTAIEGQNGTFTGDETAGSFDVSALGSTIKGTYSVSGQLLNIEINGKPFFIPCGTIESFLKNKLA